MTDPYRRDNPIVSAPERSSLGLLLWAAIALAAVAAIVYAGSHAPELAALARGAAAKARQAMPASEPASSAPAPAAGAAVGPPGAPVITNPDWIRKPDGATFARYYPQRALELGLNGRVAISCAVTAAGYLSACQVLSEDPPGYGFASAALGIAKSWRMRPMLRDGRPAEGGTFKTTIRFNIAN